MEDRVITYENVGADEGVQINMDECLGKGTASFNDIKRARQALEIGHGDTLN